MHVVFNPPPGWPPPPPGWLPPTGWEAPAQWPAMPNDWVLYLEAPTARQHARLDQQGKNTTKNDSWWGETGGYHAAYYTQTPSPVLARRWGLDAWANMRRSTGTPPAPLPSLKMVRKWRKRLLYFAGLAAILLLFLPVVNNPVNRAIYACEEAVVFEAQAAATPVDDFSLAPDVPATDPFGPSGFSRGNMRYTLADSGSSSLVTIVGDYVSPLGDWYIFNCNARHTPSPANVVEITLTPITSTSPSPAVN